MKKALLVLSSSIFLAGCIPQLTKQPQPSPTPEPQSSQDAAREFTELSEAINNGKSAECVMTNTKENAQLTYVVKGKKMKMMGIEAENGETSSMLLDTEYMYTWNDQTKQGVKFALPSEEELKEMSEQYGETSPNTPPDFSKPETQKQYEEMGFTLDCNPKDVADSEFVAPRDVTFTDTSAMMKQLQEQMKAVPTPPAQE